MSLLPRRRDCICNQNAQTSTCLTIPTPHLLAMATAALALLFDQMPQAMPKSIWAACSRNATEALSTVP
eukprot:3487038-Pyramimonas_sp.AAC.1